MKLVTDSEVLFNVDVKSQKEALHLLAEMAFEHGYVDSADTFFEELCKREEESTTGFGNGIAIPHARHKCVKEAGILFIRSLHNLEWNAIDEQPVQACVCLIAPDDKNDFHLKTLSKFARRLIHEEFVKVLKESSKEEVLKEINEVLQ